MRKILLLSLCVLFSLLSQAWAQPIPSSPWYYSNGNTAHSKPGVETVVIGGTSQGSLQLYDTTGLNKVTVLTESVLGADFIVTLPISGGGCDPSALTDGEVLYVVSGACTGDATRFFFDPAQGVNGFLSTGMGITTPVSGSTVSGLNVRGGFATYLDYAHEGSVNFHSFYTANGPPSAPTASVISDDLGEIQFNGYTSTGGFQTAALIEVDVDAAPGTNYVPGRVSIYTTSTTGTLTERFRANSSGTSWMGDVTALTGNAKVVADGAAFYVAQPGGGVSTYMDLVSFSGGATTPYTAYQGLSARGTSGAATAVASGDYILEIAGSGFDGTNYKASAIIDFLVADTVSAGVVPGKIVFSVADTTGTVQEIASMLDSSGRNGLLVGSNSSRPGFLNVISNGGNSSAVVTTSDSNTASVTISTIGGTTSAISEFDMTTLNSSFQIKMVNNGAPSVINVNMGASDDLVFSFDNSGLTEKVRFAATGPVTIIDLKTTGAATGKKIVCVDTATGTLYASSSGVACAN